MDPSRNAQLNPEPQSFRRRRARVARARWSGRRGLLIAPVAALGLVLIAGGCSSTDSGTATAPTSGTAPCPTQPLKVVVTTNVWGSVVDQLAGACALVTTVIDNPAADPHEFEPTAATSRSFAAADIAVMNGLGYDSWANKIVKSLGNDAPVVVDLGQAVGLRPGDNPHIWYSPEYVQQSARAVTSEFKRQRSEAGTAFDETAGAFETSLQPYLALVQQIRNAHAGTDIGATESVFDYMAAATGLRIVTPAGLLAAAAEHSEPSSKDVKVALTQLTDGTTRVLIYNRQVEGSLPKRMRDAARSANVPVVEITETLVPAKATFQEWQMRQLESLARALGG